MTPVLREKESLAGSRYWCRVGEQPLLGASQAVSFVKVWEGDILPTLI